MFRTIIGNGFSRIALRTAMGTAAALLAAGCVVEPDQGADAEDVAARADAINGDIDFPAGHDCSGSEQARILEAMAEVMDQLYGSGADDLEECLKDAVISPDRGHSVESILFWLREDMATQMYCKDGSPGWAASAPLEVDYEKITWSKQYLADSSIADRAGVLLHEVAHNKWWTHMDGLEYGYSVNDQVRACVRDGAPQAGISRSDVPGEVALAHVGEDGGSPFDLSCGSGAFLIGGTAGTSTYVHSLRGSCGELTGGAPSSTATAGSSVGITSTTTKECGINGVVTGIYGRSGAAVDQLGLFCSELSDVQADSTSSFKTSLGGGAGGSYFERRCPAGMAIKTIRGRASNRMDQLEIVCQDVAEDDRGTFKKLGATTLGTAAGFKDDARCTGFGAMVGLYGRSGALVDRLGGVCEPLLPTGTGGALVRQPGDEHITPAQGGWGGVDFEDTCPSTMALVGVKIRSGARIDRVQGICAKMSKWKPGVALVASDKQLLGTHGGAGGSEVTRECAQGEWLAGFETWSEENAPTAAALKGLRPICRSLAPTP